MRCGARDRARAGALALGRLRGALLSVAAVGARGLMHAPRLERARALVLVWDRSTVVLAAEPETEPGQDQSLRHSQGQGKGQSPSQNWGQNQGLRQSRGQRQR